jgi:hypothetical protein
MKVSELMLTERIQGNSSRGREEERSSIATAIRVIINSEAQINTYEASRLLINIEIPNQ